MGGDSDTAGQKDAEEGGKVRKEGASLVEGGRDNGGGDETRRCGKGVDLSRLRPRFCLVGGGNAVEGYSGRAAAEANEKRAIEEKNAVTADERKAVDAAIRSQRIAGHLQSTVLYSSSRSTSGSRARTPPRHPSAPLKRRMRLRPRSRPWTHHPLPTNRRSSTLQCPLLKLTQRLRFASTHSPRPRHPLKRRMRLRTRSRPWACHPLPTNRRSSTLQCPLLKLTQHLRSASTYSPRPRHPTPTSTHRHHAHRAIAPLRHPPRVTPLRDWRSYVQPRPGAGWRCACPAPCRLPLRPPSARLCPCHNWTRTRHPRRTTMRSTTRSCAACARRFAGRWRGSAWRRRSCGACARRRR
ncbi:hypothetical protein C8J57DRAFT_1282001, partial [Mycena rebaudengoi]